jgi:hypothetical protein
VKMDHREVWLGEGVEGGHGLNRSGQGWGQVAGFCECGNELWVP